MPKTAAATPTASTLSAASIQQTLLEYEAILGNAPVGIVFTRDQQVLHCNPKASEIYGWPHGELVGQAGRVFYRSDADYAEMTRIATPILAAGKLLDREMPMRRKDGRVIECHVRARAINPSDTAAGTIWIAEDITAQKATEQALAASQRELEQRVRERTEALAQANSQLAREVAERKEIENQLRARETRFRELSELSSDWFWEQDANFRFVDITIGDRPPNLPGSLIVGKARWELPILGITPAQWQEHQQTLQAHLPFSNLTYQVKNQHGELRWFSVSGKPMFDNGVFLGYCGIGSDITARKLAEQRVEFLAYHDPLTGLPNRLLLHDRVQQAMAHAQRTQTRMALLFLDLDNFKQINDSLGHAVGDMVLKEVATRLVETVRDTDTLSRQGGDEFVLVLSDLSDPQATLPVLTKIIGRLQEPVVANDKELSTSASVGVAIYPDDGIDFETLSKKADMAMYKAKEAGRNTYRFFDEFKTKTK
jgi:diguanylate cyclase (GGDEF)-like protein/PAS domain S-box-containing protein